MPSACPGADLFWHQFPFDSLKGFLIWNLCTWNYPLTWLITAPTSYISLSDDWVNNMDSALHRAWHTRPARYMLALVSISVSITLFLWLLWPRQSPVRANSSQALLCPAPLPKSSTGYVTAFSLAVLQVIFYQGHISTLPPLSLEQRALWRAGHHACSSATAMQTADVSKNTDAVQLTWKEKAGELLFLSPAFSWLLCRPLRWVSPTHFLL